MVDDLFNIFMLSLHLADFYNYCMYLMQLKEWYEPAK